MRRFFIISAAVFALQFISCQHDNNVDISNQDKTHLFDLSIASTRTSLGEKVGDSYPIYWSEGDRIVVNGIVSDEAIIDGENPNRAQFNVNGILETPYLITYPYCTATTTKQPIVEFSAEQSYVEGSFSANSAPMCGYVAEKASSITLKHLTGVLRFPLVAKNSNTKLAKVVVTSKNAAIAGEFGVMCSSGALTATQNTTKSITYTLPSDFALSTSVEKVLYISLPAVNVGDCTIDFFDTTGAKMTTSWSPTSAITAGCVREFKTITYEENSSIGLAGFEIFIDDFEHYLPGCNVGGYIKDRYGNPISGVVVSDGLHCTKTDSSGLFGLNSNLSDTKFIMYSVPSGYKAPNAANGSPEFYYRVTNYDIERDCCFINFTLDKIEGDPNRFTIFMGADPQARAKSMKDDRVGYHSLDICEGLYRDLRETAAKITDREVYGMMLGDLVHENMSLYTNYVAGLASLGYQTYNVIGNHDHDLSATTDVEGARGYEKHFGPSYYSFNIGKLHFISLDNIIMTVVDGKLKKNAYTYGLTDKEWTWLYNDLKYVDKSTILMVGTHSPMFRRDSTTKEYQDEANHGADYAKLFASYDKVHMWAGHTHRSFNYNYPSTSELKNIEVHTVARSTGELWTNDYNAYGTPRGYTIVEVDGENIEWRFHPVIYQSAWIGNKYSTVGKPDYIHREWDYNEQGVAVMKSTGKQLDESYQMHLFKSGDYIYANIFLWDDKWEMPKFNGSTMTLLSRSDTAAHDIAYQELHDFYLVNSILSTYSDYIGDNVYSKKKYHNSIFRIANSKSTGSGTVSVKDRFGKTHTSTITW